MEFPGEITMQKASRKEESLLFTLGTKQFGVDTERQTAIQDSPYIYEATTIARTVQNCWVVEFDWGRHVIDRPLSNGG